jgi:hypothetical protein
MAECGTHTLCYAEMGSYEQSERTLAGPVMAHADATMLITADRNFYSYAFWQQSLATGARLLFRLSSVLKLPREKILADGSYLSTIYSSTQDRKKGRGGIRVRIIEYTLDVIPDAEPRYRLITNWMDPPKRRLWNWRRCIIGAGLLNPAWMNSKPIWQTGKWYSAASAPSW